MKPWAICITAVAAAGLVLSAISHAASLFGKTGPLGDRSWILHFGVFLVWAPTLAALARLTRKSRTDSRRRPVLRGCPPWMKFTLYGFLAYALINFAIFIALPSPPAAGMMTPSFIRGFSGYWMALYAAAIAILYSDARAHRAAER